MQWIRRFILFHGKRHPREMGAAELIAFLSDLAMQHHVAASTQNQALHAILFLYRDVLKIDLPKKPRRLPVVFTREEVKALLAKGQKDWVTMLPNSLIDPLRTHLARVRQLHEIDLREGFGRVLAECASCQVSERGSRMGLAIRVSVFAALDRSAIL